MSSASASTTTDPGHAVRSDGTLKDASEIVWTYDADEDIPFSSGSASGAQEPHPSGTRYAPAVVVAGTRRTTRVHRPSKRALEAAEASTSADPGTKRKASTDPNSNRRVSRKVVIDLDNDDDDDGDNNDTDCKYTATDFDVSDFDGADAATEPADDYELFEAMADADNQVCIRSSSDLCSHLTCFSGSCFQVP